MNTEYTIECQSQNTFLVYKNGTELAYQVELHHYEPGAHRCSCPYGEHQKWEPGKVMKYCKHVTMVLAKL